MTRWCAFLACCLGVAAAAAAYWPEFRGPGGRGLAAGEAAISTTW